VTTTYFVTDVEMDGPDPARNSMMSFATVACSPERGIIESFEAVLQPRPGHEPDAQTIAWWKSQPEAYKAATKNPRDPKDVMNEYADWIETFPEMRVFAAKPLLLDGPWIDEYLKAYVSSRILTGPFKWRKMFDDFGLDLPSFLGGLFGWPAANWSRNTDLTPAWWRGNRMHTHRAIDDATGYANMLLTALKISAEREANPHDFARHLT
jgi:3' exoribonuclease, RNase T-like